MEGVLNTTYVLINGYAKDLFTAQQAYVFQVFVTKFKTDKGKELFKHYNHIFDTQSVWRGLLDHAKISTTVKIDTRKIFQCIRNVKIDDGS